MSSTNPLDFNPFQAPTATIGGPSLVTPDGDAELIRRTYLKHETSVKGIGSLSYLGAFACALVGIGCGLGAIGLLDLKQNNSAATDPRLMLGVVAGIAFFLLFLYGGIGYGLTHLQPWARWVNVGLIGLSFLTNVVQILIALATSPALAVGALIGTVIGSIIPGYVLYLMLSAKGAMVFSREYREVVRQTPHVKQKTSLIVKVLLGFLVLVLLFALIAGIVSSVAQR